MDLAKLNSATKYPSILTYHEMGDRGRLSPTVQVPFPPGSQITVTEKINGVNGRIVILPGSYPIYHGTIRRYLIGSREEFLTAQGDLIYPPDYYIVETLRPIAERLPSHPDLIEDFFFEIYGGNLPASKEYTNVNQVSFRVFDQASVPMDVLNKPREEIASWRDHGGQMFKSESGLPELLQRIDLSLARVPILNTVTELPTTLEATYEWLRPYSKTAVDLGGGKGRAEGVVVRNWDRKLIAKLRFEDYERTLGVKRG